MSSAGEFDEGGIRLAVSVRRKTKGSKPAGSNRRDMVQVSPNMSVDPKIVAAVRRAEHSDASYVSARAKYEQKMEGQEVKSSANVWKELKAETRKRKAAEAKFEKWFRQLDRATQAADRKAAAAEARSKRFHERIQQTASKFGGHHSIQQPTIPAPVGEPNVMGVINQPGGTGRGEGGRRARAVPRTERDRTPEDEDTPIDPSKIVDGELHEVPNEGLFHKWARWNQNAEAKIRKVRTKTQRLQTYGLWFVETAQHNPAYTAGKFMLNTMRLMAPPYGAVFAGLIASIVSSAYVVPQTIRNMSKKGRPWNIDWHRAVSDEVVGLFSLEEQKRRDLGLHGVIADPTSGYQPVEGTDIYNNQTIADTVRLNKLTQEQKVGRLY